MSSKQKKRPASPNAAYVAKMQGIRFSHAAGTHKQASDETRSSARRKAIDESRYA